MLHTVGVPVELVLLVTHTAAVAVVAVEFICVLVVSQLVWR